MKQSQGSSRIRTPRWPVGFVPWRNTVEQFLENLAKAAGLQIEIVGAQRSSGGDGVLTFEVPRTSGGGDFEGNWFPTAGADDEEVLITGGVVYDYNGPQVVEGDSVAVHATSMNYVYLRLSLNPNVDADGFVTSGYVSAPTFVSSTTQKTNDDDYGYVLLFRWQAGALVQRHKWFGFTCETVNGAAVGDPAFSALP